MPINYRSFFRVKPTVENHIVRYFTVNNKITAETGFKKAPVNKKSEKYAGLTIFRKTRHSAIRFPKDSFKSINKGIFDSIDLSNTVQTSLDNIIPDKISLYSRNNIGDHHQF